MKLLNNPVKPGICAMIIATLIAAQSCKNYYKVTNTPKNVTADRVIKANPERYFILRTGANAFYMNNIELSQDRKTFTCTLDTLPGFHRLHLHKRPGGNMRYKNNEEEAFVLN